jgi:hypothetical protein
MIFSSIYPNQEIEFLKNDWKDGQVVVVSDISDNVDAVTFLAVMLIHIFSEIGNNVKLGLVLKNWRYDFVGMSLENGAEIKFLVEDLDITS